MKIDSKEFLYYNSCRIQATIAELNELRFKQIKLMEKMPKTQDESEKEKSIKMKIAQLNQIKEHLEKASNIIVAVAESE